ncbi:MAG TPA: hypothetical protein PLP25_00235 [Candidatus Limiplasma sp.]|nr:hypothetical protein [Candidatus Limiplasma sp.]HPS80269.1 hypothetical protein [Candidatus Limiplasma sp.]
MKLKLKTPQGEMQLTVTQGFVGTAEVAPDGGVVFSLFPADSEPTEPATEPDGFVGD